MQMLLIKRKERDFLRNKGTIVVTGSFLVLSKREFVPVSLIIQRNSKEYLRRDTYFIIYHHKKIIFFSQNVITYSLPDVA